MTKEKATISLDSEVLEKARKQIPNLSGFIENCLKNYLGIGNGLVNTSNIHELNETISKCQLELYLMNERSNIEEAQQKAAKDEINLAWRKLYATYRDTRTIEPRLLENAVKVLNVSSEELVDIVEVLFAFRNTVDIDVTEWTEVYNEFGEGDS
jgi:hypothetical protein